MAKRSQAQREAFAKLAGIPIEQLTARPSKRVVTIWERCRKCALQMVGGERCYEHNPTPEMREQFAGGATTSPFDTHA
jgi:hypothetical protein